MNESSELSQPVSRALPEDFIDIAALDRQAWNQAKHSELIPDGEHVWRIWCEHALVYIGRSEDDEILGALVAFPCLDGAFCLHKVMVAEKCRGKGLGRKLFEALFCELDLRERNCFLTVSPSNANALKLYRNWGFDQEEFVSGYYREDEDRLVLTRRGRREK